MSEKIVNSLFFGVFMTLILDITFFIGLKVTYLEHYGVDEYFNPFFIDHQNIFITLPLILILGFLGFTIKLNKIFFSIYGILFLVTFLTFIKPIGLSIGEMLFMQKNVEITDTLDKKHIYNIIYDGRRYIYFQDPQGGGVIKIDKATAIRKADV